MSLTPRKHFDIDIVDLSDRYVDETAAIHAVCFPDKIETLLGVACIADCLRRRYVQPGGDCYSRIAIDRATGRVAGYCHAEPLRPDGGLANMFLSRAIAREHLLRNVWFRPRVWWWLARRLGRKLAQRDWNEGYTLQVLPGWEVAKMLGLHPDYRGGNVGHDLMLDNEQQARQRGSIRICGLVERSNIKAEKLYASIGWVRSSAGSERYEVFAMHRDLTAAAVAPPLTKEAPVVCTLPTSTSTSLPATQPPEPAPMK